MKMEKEAQIKREAGAKVKADAEAKMKAQLATAALISQKDMAKVVQVQAQPIDPAAKAKAEKIKEVAIPRQTIS